MKRTELTLAERRTIEDLLHRKVNVTEIARRMDCHRATVVREVKGNFHWGDPLPQLNGDYGMLAQKSAVPPSILYVQSAFMTPVQPNIVA